jgi:hypothetical protein
MLKGICAFLMHRVIFFSAADSRVLLRAFDRIQRQAARHQHDQTAEDDCQLLSHRARNRRAAECGTVSGLTA